MIRLDGLRNKRLESPSTQIFSLYSNVLECLGSNSGPTKIHLATVLSQMSQGEGGVVVPFPPILHANTNFPIAAQGEDLTGTAATSTSSLIRKMVCHHDRTKWCDIQQKSHFQHQKLGSLFVPLISHFVFWAPVSLLTFHRSRGKIKEDNCVPHPALLFVFSNIIATCRG